MGSILQSHVSQASSFFQFSSLSFFSPKKKTFQQPPKKMGLRQRDVELFMTGLCCFVAFLLIFPNCCWNNGAIRMVGAWSSATTLNSDVVLKLVLVIASFGAYFYYDAGNSNKRCVSYALGALAAGGLILFVLNHEPAGLGWAVPVLLLLGSAYLLKEHY